MQEMWVPSLSQEDPLEGEMATHSRVFGWKIPWTEESGGLQSMGSQRVRHDSSDLAHAWRGAGKVKEYDVSVASLVQADTVNK